MGVGEVVGREGVGGGVSEWIRVWKCVEKSRRFLFEGGCEATASVVERNCFDRARVDVSHAASDLFVPSGFDGFVAGVVEALDEGASEVRAFRSGKGERLFQKIGGFLCHKRNSTSKNGRMPQE